MRSWSPLGGYVLYLVAYLLRRWCSLLSQSSAGSATSSGAGGQASTTGPLGVPPMSQRTRRTSPTPSSTTSVAPLPPTSSAFTTNFVSRRITIGRQNHRNHVPQAIPLLIPRIENSKPRVNSKIVVTRRLRKRTRGFTAISCAWFGKISTRILWRR